MSSSWNFQAWVKPSYKGSEPSWNWADNTDNMYRKIASINARY